MAGGSAIGSSQDGGCSARRSSSGPAPGSKHVWPSSMRWRPAESRTVITGDQFGSREGSEHVTAVRQPSAAHRWPVVRTPNANSE